MTPSTASRWQCENPVIPSAARRWQCENPVLPSAAHGRDGGQNLPFFTPQRNSRVLDQIQIAQYYTLPVGRTRHCNTNIGLLYQQKNSEGTQPASTFDGAQVPTDNYTHNCITELDLHESYSSPKNDARVRKRTKVSWFCLCLTRA